MDVKNIKLMDWDVKLPFNMFANMLMINRPPVVGAYETDYGRPPENDDVAIKKMYEWWRNFKGPDTKSEIWGAIAEGHASFRKALDRDEAKSSVGVYLENMFEQTITDGLAQGTRYTQRLKVDPLHRENTGAAIYDKFISLFEAVGIIPTFAPEDYLKNPQNALKYYTIELDKYLQILEDHFKADFKAPKYQGGHFGIKTEGHGLYSDRDIMSLFIAIRIHERYGHAKEDIKICDLGGGVGHLVYYLSKLGFKNLTMVEVPTVAAAAVYFLETNLPGNLITVLPVDKFDGRYQLVVNVDGITGFGEDAQWYAKEIMDNGVHLYSVNKESDGVRVGDLFADWRRATRNPFWLRRGYLEEDYVHEKA
jgi:hypothetical protein